VIQQGRSIALLQSSQEFLHPTQSSISCATEQYPLVEILFLNLLQRRDWIFHNHFQWHSHLEAEAGRHEADGVDLLEVVVVDVVVVVVRYL
jgi:hypothetical protein